MSLKAAAKNRRTASGFRQALLPWFIDLPGQILPSQFKWVCISPLPCRILQGKHLPGNRSLSFQTWRHLPSCKQNGSCCRGTLSETCMYIFTKLWDCLGIRTVYNGVTYFKNQSDHIQYNIYIYTNITQYYTYSIDIYIYIWTNLFQMFQPRWPSWTTRSVAALIPEALGKCGPWHPGEFWAKCSFISEAILSYFYLSISIQQCNVGFIWQFKLAIGR
jgi:hypothetical protein